MKGWGLRIMATLLSLTSVVTNAATPAGHQITNNATVTYSVETNAGNSPSVADITLNSTVTSITASNIPAQIGLGTVSQGGSDGILQASSCISNTGTVVLPPPTFVTQNNISLPQGISFVNENIIKSGDPLFIKVFDLNQIKNPNIIETLNVTVSSKLGDKETVTLVETGPSTGVFIGYIQTARGNPVVGDCKLSAGTNDTITVGYTSATGGNVITATVLVDPLNKVFDSATGTALNGATVTLYDSNGSLAQVFGDDGKSTFPSSIVTGSAVKDSNGVAYNYGLGEFRFPLVNPGTYKVVVKPPTGYAFPSQVADTALTQKFANQYTLIVGSKGQPFSVTNKIVNLDIPLDARSGKLVVTKTSSVSYAAIGDFIQYQVTVQNTDKATVNNVVFQDILPKGFRYKAGSFFVNGKPATPQITRGTILQYNLGNLAASQSIAIKYVTEISIGSSLGNVDNTATATGEGATSNTSTATVFIKDDLMMNKAIVVGTVFETSDCKKETLKRMPNIKIQFETGDYVVSDSEGLWHIDSLAPMTHVAKLDKLYIPQGYEAALCENNNTFAGNPNTKFVEATPGNITRVDFYLKKTAAASNAPGKELSIADLLANPNDTKDTDGVASSSTKKDDKIEQTQDVAIARNNPADKKNFNEYSKAEKLDTTGKAGTEALSYNDKFMASATPEAKFLFPDDSFNPQVMAIGIAFQAPSEDNIKLFVNGSEVNKFNFDGLRQSSDRKTNILYWRGVSIKEGSNLLVAQLFNDKNEKVSEIKKEITYTGVLTQAIFVPTESKLVSNGKDPIEVAVRFMDEFGRPAHRGLTGTYDIEGPATPYITRGDGLPLEMIGALRENKTQYVVGDNGLAMIKLMPSNSAGEITLKFTLKDKTAIVRPWVSSANREWILVGIGEGTMAHQEVLNHTEADTKGMEVVENKDGRVALYGKGTIKGDYLLTFAYDNKKQTLPDSPIGQTSNNLTTSEIYSVYGDATIAQKDAASNKKLYVRIEKNQFYAMFGDFQTNLTVTDLTRYQRNLTGVKSEYKGEKFSYNAFAAKSSTLLQKEEIPSDGTTGLYHSKIEIEPNTETITIITRDRNQRDVVVQSQTLTRNVDYDIDYDLGTIRLKEAVPTYDLYFNPIFIRLEYNSIDPNGAHTVAGGRIAYKVQENTEIGFTQVNDKGAGVNDSMSGVDVQYDDQHLKVKLESAVSSNKEVDGNTFNKGYNAEAQYQGEWGSVKGYSKRVGETFGLTNSLPNDVGIQKTGADLTYKLPHDVQLTSQAIMQKDLTNDSTEKMLDNKVEKQFTPNFTGYAGIKLEQTDNPSGKVSSSLAALNGVSSVPSPTVTTTGAETDMLYTVGGQYKFSTFPLTLTGQMEANPKPSDIAPSRAKFAAQYDINERVSVIADNEYDKYSSSTVDINRIGVKTKPWEGGRVQGYVGNAAGENTNQFYQLGFDQSYKLQNWTFDAGIARQSWNKQIDLTRVPAGTLMSYDSYNVYQLGAVYRFDPFIYQSKIEDRIGTDEHKVHIENDVYRKLGGGFAVSLMEDYQTTSQLDTVSKTMEIRGGLSYRDPKNVNTVLMQLSYLINNQNTDGAQNTSKIVLNTHYDYKPNYEWEGMAHIGYKYTMNSFDDQDYKGSSYVASVGVRNYFAEKWDVAVQGLYAATPSAGVKSEGASVSVGYRVFKDAWVSVGYQKIRNFDTNFSFDESYVRGVFVKFRFKFDEESFHLNNQNSMFNNIMSK